eukprot:m.188778 g.188778  ORF g.188778 m.188778 type:complete len:77 (-) comp15089_c1_seq1:3-233(-)
MHCATRTCGEGQPRLARQQSVCDFFCVSDSGKMDNLSIGTDLSVAPAQHQNKCDESSRTRLHAPRALHIPQELIPN